MRRARWKKQEKGELSRENEQQGESSSSHVERLASCERGSSLVVLSGGQAESVSRDGANRKRSWERRELLVRLFLSSIFLGKLTKKFIFIRDTHCHENILVQEIERMGKLLRWGRAPGNVVFGSHCGFASWTHGSCSYLYNNKASKIPAQMMVMISRPHPQEVLSLHNCWSGGRIIIYLECYHY